MACLVTADRGFLPLHALPDANITWLLQEGLVLLPRAVKETCRAAMETAAALRPAPMGSGTCHPSPRSPSVGVGCYLRR